jgi:hypothetical protein
MRLRYIFALVVLGLPVASMMIYWVLITVSTKLRGPVSRCPYCDATRIRESFQRLRDKMLPSFVSPCRCESCRRRFYRVQSMDYDRRAAAR